jgi:hypothetical protein
LPKITVQIIKKNKDLSIPVPDLMPAADAAAR